MGRTDLGLWLTMRNSRHFSAAIKRQSIAFTVFFGPALLALGVYSPAHAQIMGGYRLVPPAIAPTGATLPAPIQNIPAPVRPSAAPQPVVMFTAMPRPIAPVTVAPLTVAPAPMATPPVAPASPAPMAQFEAPQNIPPRASIIPAMAQNYQAPEQPMMAEREAIAGPFTRIYLDTGRAITQDAPEALARALPWVDPAQKDTPTEDVLARVADELSRAHASDPEWVNGAERELRALATRMDRMAAPPPAVAQAQPQNMGQATQSGEPSRSFRPRPIWPGAVATIEPQRRPTTLTTQGLEENGPAAGGIAGRYQPQNDGQMNDRSVDGNISVDVRENGASTAPNPRRPRRGRQ